MSNLREEFEKLDEVKWILELCEYNSDRNMYDTKKAHFEFDEYHTNFVNGAWYAFQEQEKRIEKISDKIDSLISESELWGFDSDQANRQLEIIQELLK